LVIPFFNFTQTNNKRKSEQITFTERTFTKLPKVGMEDRGRTGNMKCHGCMFVYSSFLSIFLKQFVNLYYGKVRKIARLL